MHQITWIIENFVREKSYQDLCNAVLDAGFDCIQINGDYSKKMVEHLDGKNVIFCGSIEMTKLIKKDIPNAYPITYSTFEKYKCTQYYSHFGKYLFNDKYAILPLSEVNRRLIEIYGYYAKESLIFIRPDSGEKTFQAQLVDLQDFATFYKHNKHLEHELVLVSTPKNIQWEGRFLVDGKSIIAHSTYQFNGLVTKIETVPREAITFCEEILKNVSYKPDEIFCLDICQAKDGQYYIMELTSFSSAGLYEMNKKNVVNKVSEIAMIK